MDLFQGVSKFNLFTTLQAMRDQLASTTSTFLPEEPSVLVHKDISGDKIMLRDKQICAILDWEFSGSYPLSELLGRLEGEVVGDVDGETTEECFAWSRRMDELMAESARVRGWSEEEVELLVRAGNEELQLARIETFPDDLGGDDAEGEAET